eukprot:8139981-Pyramimonas_sp.AAC.1
MPAEQMHASAAALMRHHPDYGVETLMSRAFSHTLNRILSRPSGDERALAKQQQKLRRLSRKNPSKISARH